MYIDFVCSVCNRVKSYENDFFEKKKICWTCYKKQLSTQGKREPVTKEYVCECGTTVKRKNKARHLTSKKHLNFNKPKETKYKCECGSTTTIGHKQRHLRTEKHKQYISSLK